MRTEEKGEKYLRFFSVLLSQKRSAETKKMELPEVNLNPLWLFADNLPASGLVFELTEFKELTARDGKKKIPVFVFLGRDNKYIGDFYCSIWNVSNYKTLIKKLGRDSEKWTGKRYLVTPDQDRVILTENA